MNSSIHQVYLLNTYYVQGAGLGAGEREKVGSVLLSRLALADLASHSLPTILSPPRSQGEVPASAPLCMLPVPIPHPTPPHPRHQSSRC